MKLNTFPFGFDISLNDNIAASKRRYIQDILRSMNADSHSNLLIEQNKKLVALRKLLSKLNVTKAKCNIVR